MASTFPHVTITVAGKENDSDASGELNTLSLGYGFHQAWIYSAMFSAGVFFGTDKPFTMLFDGAYSCSLIVLVISMIFFGIALLALGVTNQMFLRFYVSKRALGLSASLICLGTYASFLVPVGGPLGTLALLFAGLATGIGSSLMVVLWGTAFARYEFSTIILNTAVSVAIGIGLYMVLTHLVPPFCSGVITGIFPIAEVFILWASDADSLLSSSRDSDFPSVDGQARAVPCPHAYPDSDLRFRARRPAHRCEQHRAPCRRLNDAPRHGRRSLFGHAHHHRNDFHFEERGALGPHLPNAFAVHRPRSDFPAVPRFTELASRVPRAHRGIHVF